MIGFLKPSSGTAYIQGMDIRTEMDRIYSCMGVCPQHECVYFSQASLSQTFGFFFPKAVSDLWDAAVAVQFAVGTTDWS